MSGRKLTVDWKHTAEELYAHYNNTPNTQIARRFQALALLRRGRTLKETAAIVGVSILPAYSPELNPVERVFCELRRCVEGVVYGSLEAKMAAVAGALGGLCDGMVRLVG